MKCNTLILFLVSCLAMNSYSQSTITVGSGTTATTYSPIASWYNSSATESIYTSGEINLAGEITKIAYQKASGNSTVQPHFKIYMKQTTENAIPSSDYSIDNGFLSYTLVYDGVLPNDMTTGWMEVSLQAPFSVTGSKNLSILVIGSTCIESGRPQYCFTTSQSSKMCAGYNDANIACEGNNPWSQNSLMKPVWERPNIRLTFGTLANKEFSMANTLIYSDNGILTCRASYTINNIAVYDILGKEIYTLKNINNNVVSMPDIFKANRMLFLKITNASNESIIVKTMH